MSTATLQADALAQKLADSGLRATPQREVVYDVLLKKRDHPTADEVFARVKAVPGCTTPVERGTRPS